jgi:HlyD family secretion protein
MKAALAALNLAKKSLDDTLIRSPVDGVIVKRSVEVGQTVAASLQSPEIFIIARNLAEMQVETSIDESDVGRIEVGQEASFTVDAFPNKTFQGKVKQIRKAPVNIQNVVTYTVLISADNPDLKLLPGMTANARIVVEKKEKVLKVANTALRFRLPQGDKSAANRANKNGNTQATPWWKFWEKGSAPSTTSASTSSSTNVGADRSATGGWPGAGGNSQRASRFGSGQSNFRSVYVLEKQEGKDVPVRKVFRLGLTDGDCSEILPVREGKEVSLKVGDQVITGIEGGSSAGGTRPSGGPRMF